MKEAVFWLSLPSHFSMSSRLNLLPMSTLKCCGSCFAGIYVILHVNASASRYCSFGKHLAHKRVRGCFSVTLEWATVRCLSTSGYVTFSDVKLRKITLRRMLLRSFNSRIGRSNPWNQFLYFAGQTDLKKPIKCTYCPYVLGVSRFNIEDYFKIRLLKILYALTFSSSCIWV